MSRRVPPLLAALLAVVLLGGCVGLPDEGPVVESSVTEEQDAHRPSDIDARPPVPGASRTEVVTGFLEAMTAWPVQTSVAKQYLTDEAAGQWNPERETIVYGDALPARELGGEVSVELTAADRLDEMGAWRGPLPDDEMTLRFRITIKDGEFRISDLRDALVVPAPWFQQRYRQVSLYYFDPIASILVPEPVFVPKGDQLATTLVSALFAGPPPRVRGLVRSFLPRGLSVGLSVPVDEEGVAAITLVGDAPSVRPEAAELLLAQLAWTLRQDSHITAFRVSVGGTDLAIPGGGTTYPVDGAARFDPAGADATTQLFGTSRGRLLSGGSGALVPATGPFGEESAGILEVTASTDGDRAAAVDQGGRRLRLAPVEDPAGAPAQTVLTTNGTFAKPTWDHRGRLWVLERRQGAAVVWSVRGSRARRVDVPGISGRRAHRLLVSRDGTRLIGVVRTAAGDEVVGARVVLDRRGRVARVREPFVVRAAEGSRIQDIAWNGPVHLALLTPTQPRALYEVDNVPVDGAAIGADALSTLVPGDVIGLAGSPTPRAATLAIYADHYADVVTQEEYDVDVAPLDQLDYSG
ncbi:LpqB family beta-propeller domain-containing protein [Nocardioides sp. SYSU DS0651]|uniref:LpqB family beta-propeller domain-containing protein n=1 Tax=Nocardioides sp. SYSU DS0651 TaxID=3415955 RepID=UPI003F4B6BBD